MYVRPRPRFRPRNAGGVAFSPALLFTGGVQGAWYDPSDVLLNWRTNLLTYSQEFDNAAWTKSAITISANAGVAPDGTTTADKFIPTVSFAAHNINQTVSSTSGTFSIYAKADGETSFSLWLVGASIGVVFDLTAQTASPTSGSISGTIQSVGSGWFRCTATSSSATTTAHIYARSGGGFSGDGTSGIYIWGAQLELGSTATTYQAITTPEQTYLTYDPQPVLYQDSSGTTPVTAVEQPVGLMLDKSQGLALTPTAIDGNLNTATWTKGTGWSAPSARSLVCDGTQTGSSDTSASYTKPTGALVRWSFTISAISGTLTVYPTGGAPSTFTTTGAKTVCSDAASNFNIFRIGAGQTCTITDIRIEIIAGNHASQATAASRPVLRARYNLLTYSEQFDNAAWTTTSATVSANTTATTDPLGGNTADSLVASAALSQHRIYQAVTSSDYTLSVYAKAGTANFISLSRSNNTAYATFNLSTGVVSASAGGTATIQNAGNGWWRCAIASTVATSYLQIAIGNTAANAEPNVAWLGAGENVYVWGAQTVTGFSAGTYQRIAAATDYATAGFLPYLALDGTDDSLATGSINFTATDKMSVCAGITKLSDAAAGILSELSADSNANNGVFALTAPGSVSDRYTWVSRGSILAFVVTTSSSYNAPTTNVITGLGNISGDSTILRINGTQIATSPSDQGTGNFGNYPLYIGRRNNAAFPFNGRIYQMVVCGKTLSADELASTEAYVNSKTGAY